MQDLFTPHKEKRRNSFVSTQNSTLLRMKYCVKNRHNQIKSKRYTEKDFLSFILAFVAYMEKYLCTKGRRKHIKLKRISCYFRKYLQF